eukprot:3231557-Rhodomonas_salina.1
MLHARYGEGLEEEMPLSCAHTPPARVSAAPINGTLSIDGTNCQRGSHKWHSFRPRRPRVSTAPLNGTDCEGERESERERPET